MSMHGDKHVESPLVPEEVRSPLLLSEGISICKARNLDRYFAFYVHRQPKRTCRPIKGLKPQLPGELDFTRREFPGHL